MLGKKHRNIFILLFSSILLLVSAYYFFLGIQIQETGKVPDIGTVFKKDNDLRRKNDGSLTWIDIENSSKLYPGDKVFTGSQSLAQLNLLDLAEIGMNSSTLLKIDSRDLDSLNLHGGNGFFTTKLSGKVLKTSVKLKDTTLELTGKGSEIHVNSSEEKTMVSSVAGNVSYQTVGADGKAIKKTLSNNQVLGMNKAGVATVVDLPVRLISPSISEEILATSLTLVIFKWKVLTPNVPLSLELSKTPTFEKPFFKKEVSGFNEIPLTIDPAQNGVVYWRIIQPGKEEYFHSQQFDYQPLSPPVVYHPVIRENVPIPVPRNIEFSWEKKFDFQYEGEIQQLDGGISGAQKFTSSAATYKPKNLIAGHYQFRICAKKKKVVSDWSPWIPFSVGDVDRNGIELVSPADQSIAELAFPQKEVKFTWSGGGVQSQIIVAKDQAFKDVILEGITDKSEYLWHPEKVGTYFWHVRGSPRDKLGTFRSFSIKEPKLFLHLPKNNTDYLYQDEGYQEINFVWEESSINGKYVFEYAEDPGFLKVIENVEVDKASHVVSFPKKDQEIYWRVKTETQVSPAWSFRIFPKPQLEPPVVDMVKVKILEDKTIFGGSSGRLPSQYGSGFVEIFLPTIEKASSYKVEIMRDLGPKSLIFSKTLKSPLFRWNNPTAGDYFYRLSYVDKNGLRSPLSDVARLSVEPKDKPPTPEDPDQFHNDKLPTY